MLFVCLVHKIGVDLFVFRTDHFNAVAEAILSAKVEIYIADWWLTPELVGGAGIVGWAECVLTDTCST